MHVLIRTFFISFTVSIGWLPLAEAGQQRPDIPVINPAERAIERQIERAARQAERIDRNLPDTAESARNRALERFNSHLPSALQQAGTLNPMRNLPTRLSVTDHSGAELFVDIEVEPGRRAVERQWVMMVTNEDLTALEKSAPALWQHLTESQELSGLGKHILKFMVPRHLDNRAGIEQLLPESFHNALDRNHIYQASRDSQASPSQDPVSSRDAVKLEWPGSAACRDAVRIGVVDTSIHQEHPAFHEALAENRLIRHNFLGSDVPQPGHHGTAVTGVLIGATEQHSALLPNATVYHAEAFYKQSMYHQGATLSHLIQALNWLQEQQVHAINLSLTGPENRLLKSTVQALYESDIVIVAAVGNEGPHAPALYPAAFQEVIGATAVDKNGEIYRWANQGDYVEFSGFGVSVLSPRADNQWGYESGTSMAAPFVTAHAACSGQANVAATRNQLRQVAIPLHYEKPSSIYGYGLLHSARLH